MRTGASSSVMRYSRVLAQASRRLSVTRGAAGTAAAQVYRPGSWRGRMVKRAVLTAAQLPTTSREAGDSLLASSIATSLGAPDSGIAAFDSSTPGRRIYGFSQRGRLTVVAKVAPLGDGALAHELEFTASLPREVPTPDLIHAPPPEGHVLLATAAVDGTPTLDIGTALEVSLLLARHSLTHGDFAPWNLLSTDRGPVLLDWESSDASWRPCFDLIHFLYQSARLLGRASPQQFVELCESDAGVLADYAASTRCEPLRRDQLRRYLHEAPTDAFRERALLALT